MTIEMDEFDQLKHKFYEQFAKEYNITLREGDMAAPAAEPPAIQPASTDPVPLIQPPKDIAPGVAADTSLQTEPLPEDGTAEIVFNKGNLNTIQGSLKTLLRKPALVTRTFLPLVEKALIELLGNSSSYTRDSFVYNITVSNNQIVYDVSMTYSVSLFIGTDIDKAAVAHDQKYIADTISVVPGIRIKNVAIDTSTGLVSISVEI
jgi:hypothetical protein